MMQLSQLGWYILDIFARLKVALYILAIVFTVLCMYSVKSSSLIFLSLLIITLQFMLTEEVERWDRLLDVFQWSKGYIKLDSNLPSADGLLLNRHGFSTHSVAGHPHKANLGVPAHNNSAWRIDVNVPKPSACQATNAWQQDMSHHIIGVPLRIPFFQA